MLMKGVSRCILFLFLVLLPSFAQQTPFNRVEISSGYSLLRTPSLSMNQHGFSGSVGFNVSRWLGLNTDFSVYGGSGNPTLADTKLAPLFPAISTNIPMSRTTSLMTFGPQINMRQHKFIMPWVRAGLGFFHSSSTYNFGGLGAGATLPSGVSQNMTDTGLALRVGGGVDFKVTNDFSIRTGVDYVYANPDQVVFKNMGAFTFSIGTKWSLSPVQRRR